MHIKKKASAEAGQKLKQEHYQLAASCVQANRSVDPSPYEKPSRRNRRQKRTWRRKPGNSLTWSTGLAHTFCTVLNTPQLAVSAPVSQSGFFTSIGFSHVDPVSTAIGQWPGSVQPYNSLRAKSASRLVAVLKCLATPQQGANSTNQLGAIMAKILHLFSEDRPPVNQPRRRGRYPRNVVRLSGVQKIRAGVVCELRTPLNDSVPVLVEGFLDDGFVSIKAITKRLITCLDHSQTDQAFTLPSQLFRSVCVESEVRS